MEPRMFSATAGVAFLLAAILLAYSFSPVAAMSPLDYVVGVKPGFARAENIDPHTDVAPGEYCRFAFKVAVKRWIHEPEEVVRERAVEYYQRLLAEEWDYREFEPPVYAAFIYTGDRRSYGLYDEYVYDVEIIARARGGVPWAIVAAIIILATVVAVVVLVNNPAVQQLIRSAAENMNAATVALVLIAAAAVVAAVKR